MTLAQMQLIIQNLAPQFRKIKTLLETMRSSLRTVVQTFSYLLTTATTPASGSCAVELTFTNSEGTALTAPISGVFYLSEVATGLSAAAADTGITASKGVVSPVVSTSHYHYITNATGELDLTITALADSYWVVFPQPDGTLLISDEVVVNA